jgi:hypothetical protein
MVTISGTGYYLKKMYRIVKINVTLVNLILPSESSEMGAVTLMDLFGPDDLISDSSRRSKLKPVIGRVPSPTLDHFDSASAAPFDDLKKNIFHRLLIKI